MRIGTIRTESSTRQRMLDYFFDCFARLQWTPDPNWNPNIVQAHDSRPWPSHCRLPCWQERSPPRRGPRSSNCPRTAVRRRQRMPGSCRKAGVRSIPVRLLIRRKLCAAARADSPWPGCGLAATVVRKGLNSGKLNLAAHSFDASMPLYASMRAVVPAGETGPFWHLIWTKYILDDGSGRQPDWVGQA